MKDVAGKISDAMHRARTLFRSGTTRDLAWRRAQLRRMLSWLETSEATLLAALKSDLAKPELEAYASEILTIKGEIRHVLKHLSKWSRRKRVRPPWFIWPAQPWIQPEPYGVVLVLAPWNYPLYLALMPVVNALAAGNVAVIKPSEWTPQSVLQIENLASVLDPGAVAVISGAADVAELLLEQPFDFIFFTGGGAIGRRVGVRAAERGVPCVLELGGKNPCIVDETAPVEATARRIVWAKFFNAGQTCVAPDSVWVHRSLYEPLLAALERVVRQFYGEDPLQSPDLARLIHERHFERVKRFIAEGKVVCGGRSEVASLRIEPTILTDVSPDADVMREEIFGPVLPVLPYDELEDVLSALREDTPLALYIHTRNREVERRVLGQTRSGSVCINDHIMQINIHGLPFGGVGESGIGRYHGRHGFDTFSHMRAILRQPSWLDNPLRYPPTAGKLRWIKKILG
jgi:aldehyde dehydrogenase (NAD+)